MTTQLQGRSANQSLGCLIAVATSLAIGCSQSGSTAPSQVQSRQTVNADGTWIGKTSQAGATTPLTNVSSGFFSVAVVNSQVVELNVQVSFPAPCRGELTAGWTLHAPVSDQGTFSYSISSMASSLDVSGGFTSDGHASGSITVTYGNTISCPSTVTTQWTATK
jgi:hypothetical protein